MTITISYVQTLLQASNSLIEMSEAAEKFAKDENKIRKAVFKASYNTRLKELREKVNEVNEFVQNVLEPIK